MKTLFRMFSGGKAAAAPQPIPEHVAIAMVVDDEPGIRGLMAMSLRQCGYHVIEAPHGLSAITQARELGRMDLLVADLELQGLPGAHVAANLRETFCNMPVVFTANRRPAHRMSDPVLMKPFQCGTLLKTVAEATGLIAVQPRLSA